MREREERERGGFGGRMDELTRMNQNFESGAYVSLPVCEMQPTVIDITVGFYYQPIVIISITHCRFIRKSDSNSLFSYEPAVMHLSVSVLKFR